MPLKGEGGGRGCLVSEDVILWSQVSNAEDLTSQGSDGQSHIPSCARKIQKNPA